MTIDGQTVTGVEYCFDDINPSQIRIADIAHGLANICRYNGQVKEFFSVAQHSIFVSKLVKPKNALWGLLHDASEAYLGDLTYPFKAKEKYKAIGDLYQQIEERILWAVGEHFDLKPKFVPDEVKHCDRLVRAVETKCLFGTGEIVDLTSSDEMIGICKVFPLEPREAKNAFLARFLEIIEHERQEDQTANFGSNYERRRNQISRDCFSKTRRGSLSD